MITHAKDHVRAIDRGLRRSSDTRSPIRIPALGVSSATHVTGSIAPASIRTPPPIVAPPLVEMDLVHAAAQGDRDAFTMLHSRYIERVTHLVMRNPGSRSESEEVIQEVFLQVYRSLPRFEGRSTFHSWIHRVAVNVGLQHVRRSLRRHRVIQLSPTREAMLSRPPWLAGTDPEQDAEYNELVQETSRVINDLPPNQRDAMILGPVQGRSCKEVASILGVRSEVVKARLHRARVRVRDSMWPENRSDGPGSCQKVNPATCAIHIKAPRHRDACRPEAS